MKDAKGVSLREGSMVRARWKGGSQYFTGYVHNVDLDGTGSQNDYIQFGLRNKRIVVLLLKMKGSKTHNRNQRMSNQMASFQDLSLSAL